MTQVSLDMVCALASQFTHQEAASLNSNALATHIWAEIRGIWCFSYWNQGWTATGGGQPLSGLLSVVGSPGGSAVGRASEEGKTLS